MTEPSSERDLPRKTPVAPACICSGDATAASEGVMLDADGVSPPYARSESVAVVARPLPGLPLPEASVEVEVPRVLPLPAPPDAAPPLLGAALAGMTLATGELITAVAGWVDVTDGEATAEVDDWEFGELRAADPKACVPPVENDVVRSFPARLAVVDWAGDVGFEVEVLPDALLRLFLLGPPPPLPPAAPEGALSSAVMRSIEFVSAQRCCSTKNI